MAADELMHELVAAYALDALDAAEERAFEAHLARCESCQEELAAFAATVDSLAYSVPAAEPPTALRSRILTAARAQQSNVVSVRPRWAVPALAVAAVASCVAIGLGTWIGVHAHAGPSASALHTLPLRGAAGGSLVVAKDGSAALVLSGLPPAPAGKTYEAWVIRGQTALPAGLFNTASGSATVRLGRRVGRGSLVGVTLERSGGASKPSEPPLVTSARV